MRDLTRFLPVVGSLMGDNPKIKNTFVVFDMRVKSLVPSMYNSNINMAHKFTKGRLLTFTFSLVSKDMQKLIAPRWIMCRPSCPLVLSMNGFHISPSSNVDHRKKKSIVRHLNHIDHEKTLKHRNNPLVSLPDYTYSDGRPTEITLSQKEREEKNYQMAKKIVQLVDEMKFAQNQLKEQEKAKDEHIRQRQESRLKQKEIPLD